MSLNIITVTLNMGKISLWHLYFYSLSEPEPFHCNADDSCCVFALLRKADTYYFLHLFSTEKYNFLGISIVGQSNDRGDGGIYIGSIMKGGAVAADGRIEPGDMLLQV